MGTDKQIGEFTFVGPTGNSVIDYGICSDYLCTRIENFEIGDRRESCHFPVIITFDLSGPEIANCEYEDNHQLRTRYIFDQINIDQYKTVNSKQFNTGKLDELLKEIE